MKDGPGLQIKDIIASLKRKRIEQIERRRIESGNSKSLRILLGILLVLIFAGSILYFFLSKRPTDGELSLLESKVTGLEQKAAELEKQLAEVQEKISTFGSDPALLQRVDTLALKVEELEKQPIAQLKTKPSSPSKSAVSSKKLYHTVKKGETLYRISKKYGISVNELRKLNKLSADQPIRIGQKLLVSPLR
jgi:LysM repeat protein